MAKILIVEDNELGRDMLRRRLNRHGFEVILATNGRTALSETCASQPDLILMDIGLGEESGLDVIAKIRAKNCGKKIPIVALTAHAMVGDRNECMAVGCNDFETKPVEFDRLLRKIRFHLDNG